MICRHLISNYLFTRFVIQGNQSVVLSSQPKILEKKTTECGLIRLSKPDMELPRYLRSNKGMLSVVNSTLFYIRRLLKKLKAHFLKVILSVCQYFGVALKTCFKTCALSEVDIKVLLGYMPGIFGSF